MAIELSETKRINGAWKSSPLVFHYLFETLDSHKKIDIKVGRHLQFWIYIIAVNIQRSKVDGRLNILMSTMTLLFQWRKQPSWEISKQTITTKSFNFLFTMFNFVFLYPSMQWKVPYEWFIILPQDILTISVFLVDSCESTTTFNSYSLFLYPSMWRKVPYEFDSSMSTRLMVRSFWLTPQTIWNMYERLQMKSERAIKTFQPNFIKLIS